MTRTITPIKFRVEAHGDKPQGDTTRITHKVTAFRGDAEQEARTALDRGYWVAVYNENDGRLLQGPIDPAWPYPAILDKSDLAQGINRTL